MSQIETENTAIIAARLNAFKMQRTFHSIMGNTSTGERLLLPEFVDNAISEYYDADSANALHEEEGRSYINSFLAILSPMDTEDYETLHNFLVSEAGSNVRVFIPDMNIVKPVGGYEKILEIDPRIALLGIGEDRVTIGTLAFVSEDIEMTSTIEIKCKVNKLIFRTYGKIILDFEGIPNVLVDTFGFECYFTQRALNSIRNLCIEVYDAVDSDFSVKGMENLVSLFSFEYVELDGEFPKLREFTGPGLYGAEKNTPSLEIIRLFGKNVRLDEVAPPSLSEVVFLQTKERRIHDKTWKLNKWENNPIDRFHFADMDFDRESIAMAVMEGKVTMRLEELEGTDPAWTC